MRLPVLAKSIAELFKTLMAILHSLSQRSLQVFDEECWLTGRGNDGRVVRIESQLDLAGRGWHIVYMQAE